MTILEKTPIPMVEAREIVDKMEEKKELKDYFKRFTKTKKDKAETLKKELTDLNSMKMKQEDMAKIIDFLPQTQEEINKIFTDVSLSEEEANAILEIVKKH